MGVNLGNLAAAFCFLCTHARQEPKASNTEARNLGNVFSPAPAATIWRPHRLPQYPSEEYLAILHSSYKVIKAKIAT